MTIESTTGSPDSSAPILTIDGPSGAGKGTVSRQVALELGWHYLDSGALYRIVAIAAAERLLTPEQPELLASMALELDIRFDVHDNGDESILLDGKEVGSLVRLETTGEAASQIAVVPEVRAALVAVQHGFAQLPGLVADGRDMGTVIFPQAESKVFLDASAEERAERRYKQLKDKGVNVNLARLREEIEARDARDRGRKVAPLKPADDAEVVDTTSMKIDEVIETVLGQVSQPNR